MKHAVLALFGLALLASNAASSTSKYRVTADCGQMSTSTCGPGVVSAGAIGIIDRNNNQTLTGSVTLFGVTNPTSVRVYKGAPGTDGPPVFTLTGGPVTWNLNTSALTAAQLADLSAGLYYIQVNTMALPGGAIRGQLLPSPTVFGARLDNTQQVPPTGSTAKGNASLKLNADHSLSYTVTTSGLAGGTAAELRTGPFGASGALQFVLAGGPVTWSGTTLPLSDSQIGELQFLGWYVNVKTAALPGGAIRGQIVPSGEEVFNSPSAAWASMLTMTVSGAPTDVADNGTFTLAITGGKPFGSGLMLVSLTSGASLLDLQPFLVGLPLLLNFSLPLDGSGAITLPVLTPSLPMSLNLSMQFFGLDNTAANGTFNASNGIAITLQHF